MGRGLPQFTVRQLLAVVAIAAVLCAMAAGVLRGLKYREQALRHTRIITQLDRSYTALFKRKATAKPNGAADPQADLGLGEGVPSTDSRPSPEDAQMAKLIIRKQCHERLRDKYERAAQRPWLPVEPDPPGFE